MQTARIRRHRQPLYAGTADRPRDICTMLIGSRMLRDRETRARIAEWVVICAIKHVGEGHQLTMHPIGSENGLYEDRATFLSQAIPLNGNTQPPGIPLSGVYGE